MEAENRFQLTKDLFLEGMGLVSRDSYGKTARIGTFVLLGAWLVLLIAALAARQSKDISKIASTAVAVLMIPMNGLKIRFALAKLGFTFANADNKIVLPSPTLGEIMSIAAVTFASVKEIVVVVPAILMMYPFADASDSVFSK